MLRLISSECSVQEVTGTASKGSYNLETGVICVNADYDYMQKAKTFLHEYAHAMDFKMRPDMDIKKNVRELVAESVAFVVAKCLEFDTSCYSISCINSWLKDTEELKSVAETIQKISSCIINKISESEDKVNCTKEVQND